jgi:hypothetical protein
VTGVPATGGNRFLRGLAILDADHSAVLAELDDTVVGWAREAGASTMCPPPLYPVDTLEKFDVYINFPHLSLVAGPLKPVEGLAPENGCFSPGQMKTLNLALPTATCFGAYLFFEGRKVAPTELVTLVNRCFRAEDHVDGLRRLLSFQMREIVALGSYDHTQEVLVRFTNRIEQFLGALGLSYTRKAASDPFFQGEGSRALLQKMEAVKHEFVVDDLAIASLNTHRNFFGERCRITTDGDGGTAFTSCVAFGLERWVSVLVAAHGSAPRALETVRHAVSILQPA